MNLQVPNSVVMIRPFDFHQNPETRKDNAFQSDAKCSPSEIAERACGEFDGVVTTLRNAGVTVHDIDDKSGETPDSVFPNNWLSTHAGGHVAFYLMFAEIRRLERRWDIIEMLKRDYRVQAFRSFGVRAGQFGLGRYWGYGF